MSFSIVDVLRTTCLDELGLIMYGDKNKLFFSIQNQHRARLPETSMYGEILSLIHFAFAEL